MQHATIVPIMDDHTPPAPLSIGDAADDNLLFIRRMMSLSREFAAVSGVAMVLTGVLALAGAWWATRQPDSRGWLQVWLALATVCSVAGFGAMIVKSRRTGQPLTRGAGRRFLLQFAAPMVAGAALTVLFTQHRLESLLPAVWMLLYGTAVLSAGAYSLRIIPIMGAAFVATGVIACLVPDAVLPLPGHVRVTDLLLATSFGGFHILFGARLARHHEG
ncbi:MAG: hypothetical protein RL760_649 [Candidatus Eisenbacteria bacterium]|jgi:drug/metabolite transporter (DMT)-like permease